MKLKQGYACEALSLVHIWFSVNGSDFILGEISF